MGDSIGTIIGDIQGDTRSLDYSSCEDQKMCPKHGVP